MDGLKMLTRNDVLSNAADECMKELYSLAQPSIDWEEFIKENKNYIEKENEYYKLPKESRPGYKEYMGPKPYEFYYLPEEVMKEVCDSYISAYRINQQQNLLDIIKILKDYCKKPITDKYVKGKLREDGTRYPGHRGYNHPDNLEKEISTILCLDNTLLDPERAENADDYDNKLDNLSKQCCSKFFEFLDMAGNFFRWNRDLNFFNTHVYLGASPNSNKQAVIDNWKKYKNKEIKINDDVYDEERCECP